MGIGDYYWGLYRGYYRDPFPHSREKSFSAVAVRQSQRLQNPQGRNDPLNVGCYRKQGAFDCGPSQHLRTLLDHELTAGNSDFFSAAQHLASTVSVRKAPPLRNVGRRLSVPVCGRILRYNVLELLLLKQQGEAKEMLYAHAMLISKTECTEAASPDPQNSNHRRSRELAPALTSPMWWSCGRHSLQHDLSLSLSLSISFLFSFFFFSLPLCLCLFLSSQEITRAIQAIQRFGFWGFAAFYIVDTIDT